MATGDKLVNLTDLKTVYDKQTANNAPVFSASNAYAAGDYVIYGGALYRFTSAHAAGAWTGSDAVATQLSAEIGDQKSAINVTNTEIGIYKAEHYESSTLRWAIIPFTFENGKSYFIDIKNSENNMSEVRIAKAGTLSNTDKITSWSSISAKNFSVKYDCAVDNATYLIIITPNTNTSISVDYAICAYSNAETQTRLATAESNIATLQTSNNNVLLHIKSVGTICFQKQAPEYNLSGNYCVVKFYVNSANASGFFYNLQNETQAFSPVSHGTVGADGGYTFSVNGGGSGTDAQALVIDTLDIVSGNKQLNVKALKNIAVTDIVLLYYYKTDVVNPIKGVLGEYFTNNNFSARIDALESEMEDGGYPSYYDTDDYLKNKIAKINNSAPANGTVIGFITDLHFGANQMNSVKLLKYIQKQTAMNTIICGGDFIDAYGNSTLLQTDIDKTMQYAKELYPNWFALRGNHDFTIRESAESSNGTTIEDGITYNTIVRSCADWRYEVSEPETSFFDAQYNMNKNYCWTLTNEKAKIRVIAFCDFNVTNTSTYWGVGGRITNAYAKYLAQMLLASDGYSIILLTHAPITNKLGVTENNIISVIKKFVRRESITLGSYVMDFTNATGTLICSLSGHTHKDQFVFIDGFLNVNTTCDATFNNDPGVTRTSGTISEQAFDVMNIDTDNKTLECIRIGGGYDRIFHYQAVNVSASQTVTSAMSGTLIWDTSDSSVATVSNGTITKVSSGECYVYATDENGNKEYWPIVT